MVSEFVETQLSPYLFKKTLLKLAGATTTLGQSASWRGLFVGFSSLARVMNWPPAPMQKGMFLWLFQGDVFREIEAHT